MTVIYFRFASLIKTMKLSDQLRDKVEPTKTVCLYLNKFPEEFLYVNYLTKLCNPRHDRKVSKLYMNKLPGNTKPNN